MNFSPFGGHFPSAIPTIHQFAAKFTQDSVSTSNGVCIQPTIVQDTNNRYTANGVPSFTQHHHPSSTGAVHQIMSSKYQNGVPASTAMGTYPQNLYGHQSHLRNETNAKRFDPHQELAQELCAVMMQNSQEGAADDKNHEKLKLQPNNIQTQLNNQILNTPTSLPATWQSLATPGGSVADYLSHLPASTLPLSLHQFLKYSAENIKKETTQNHSNDTNNDLNFNLGQNGGLVATNSATLSTVNTAQLQGVVSASTKKKKKKKVDKEKKPRPKPGEIRLTTALDGSILYCCPECHMAYPEKELLEQHLVGHTLERRFVCDICGAGLKRKDHLTRHKQSHNPERPFVCTVCLKAFKRKEQLTLHFVIHSGEKRHICTECGKGFYRKDHLRKHTRSHIARRVKAELSQSGQSGNGASGASLNIGS